MLLCIDNPHSEKARPFIGSLDRSFKGGHSVMVTFAFSFQDTKLTALQIRKVYSLEVCEHKTKVRTTLHRAGFIKTKQGDHGTH